MASVITVGDKVTIRRKKKNLDGVIRFIGKIQAKIGIFYGIELHDFKGENDGSSHNVPYFKCEPKKGIFVPKTSIVNTTANKIFKQRKTINDEIMVPDIGTGLIRFIGIPYSFDEEDVFYGIQLKKPKGEGYGTVNNRWYFTCPKNCAIFVKCEKNPPPKVYKEKEPNEYDEKDELKTDFKATQQIKPKAKDVKIELSLECKLGKLVQSLPMEGKITYEKENKFWSIQLGKDWQDNKFKFAQLTDTLFGNEKWYKEGIERGKQWAKLVNESNIDIKTIPPTSKSGLHITLTRIDINDEKKPNCFVEGRIVEFKAKRLLCHPPFRPNPKNLPGQKMVDSEYQYYATHWMALAVEFVNFNYQTRFPPHISLCNIAVKLKKNDVKKLDETDSK